MVKDYYDVRAVFKKTDRAIYISHLDLMRVIQRTFKRAGVPIWFTKGYNPHAYIMFSLPLSLGVSSECEVMDFGIDFSAGKPDYEDIKTKLNSALPVGIEIVKVYEPVKPHTEIGSCDYTAEFVTNLLPAESVRKLFDEFVSQENIYIEKRAKVNMKKTIVTVDIKPDIQITDISCDSGNLLLHLHLPAGIKHSLNIVAVADAFEKYCNIEFDKKCLNRTKIYDIDGGEFI